MAEFASALPDPRIFPAAGAGTSSARDLYALAEASLAADTGELAAAADRPLRASLLAMLAGDGAALDALVAGAPSVAVARRLWRALDDVWRDGSVADDGVAVTLLALPVVIVTGSERRDGGTLPGVVGRPEALVSILRSAGALRGNRTFGLSNALVATESIDIAHLPEFWSWRRLPDPGEPALALPARALEAAPIAFHGGRESVHLRFLVGTAIAKAGADLVADAGVGAWGLPLAQALATDLGVPGVSVLALPRAPQRLLPAVAVGRAAQREVSAQIFASNAIRGFRGSVGEPTAVISAHRASDVPGGGELRLSLSSPFDARAAEGFRCPLYAQDSVRDVLRMLVDLVRDCRVTDIRVVDGVHPDRVAGNGLPLLFTPDTIPRSLHVTVH